MHNYLTKLLFWFLFNYTLTSLKIRACPQWSNQGWINELIFYELKSCCFGITDDHLAKKKIKKKQKTTLRWTLSHKTETTILNRNMWGKAFINIRLLWCQLYYKSFFINELRTKLLLSELEIHCVHLKHKSHHRVWIQNGLLPLTGTVMLLC